MFTAVTACASYGIAWMLLLLSFKAQRLLLPCYLIILSAFCVHLDVLYRVIDTPAGQNLHVVNLISLIMALWVGIVGLANLKTRLKSLFVVVLPLAALSLVPLFHESPATLVHLGDQPWALSHILIALAAYALLGVAFVQAMVLALQRWYLSHAPGHRALPLLPPLEAMQRLMMTIFLSAFVALTIAIGLGIEAHGLGPTFWTLKNVTSLLVWGLALVILVWYYRSGLQVRYAIVGIVLAWMMLSVAYVGMKL